MDNDQELLLKAALLKLMHNEPMSLNDLHRIIDLIQVAKFEIQGVSEDELAATQSKLITILQEKFMKGQQQM